MIGGYAVMMHTEPRYTKDLDLWIDPSRENARRVYLALAQFGAPLAGFTETDFTERGTVYQLGRPPARIDVLMSVSGLEFDEAWPNRVISEVDGLPIAFAGRGDLIKMKRAAGRTSDLVDIERLEESGGTSC